MLRQLARLTRRVPAAGPKALAIAVYSGSQGRPFGARESGVEGVACVDDAARGLVLLSRLWVRTGNHELRRWAMGLLDFILWMHDGDGRWLNFIYDWEGTRNQDGLTSAPGANFWQARAIEALTVAVLLFDPPAARSVLQSGFAAAAASSPPADVRSLHAGAALELLRFEPDPWLTTELGRWCDEIAGCTSDGMLMNSPDERGQPHLWGHTQEGVLIQAARSLGRGDLEVIARTSAGAVFGEAIASGFDLPHVQPYDVQSAVQVMSRLHSETGDEGFGRGARRAREWFSGRNPARLPVYMRDAGRVADGVDDGTVNEHSGAEANIAAGLALIDDGFVRALAAAWPRPAWISSQHPAGSG
ncbi:MAG: hypothetical protein NVS9B1_22950 [Candidatus Dormibacteraceae bacterium]